MHSSIFDLPKDRTPMAPRSKGYLSATRLTKHLVVKGEGRPVGIITIEELPARLAGGKTLAGLDLGDKTIGVAVSDQRFSFAHPRPVIMRRKFSLDAAVLLALLQKENAGAVVIG
ncbi:Holliday junction resolvase RuvX, partial [Mesorhizobium sp. M7A.F.Ca.CA.001.05.1.1]|uniref:Holliday junction resolvase RuvX n=1 Tax=Mesorhizobium sp. M7A.F.Ca.CA.001.05.1.1 TaxID=2496721 RepID=UPI001FDF0356